MGLNLKPRNLLDDIGGAVTNVAHGIGNLAGGVERQLNPLDNGATFSNPHPAPVPSVGQQAPRTLGTPAGLGFGTAFGMLETPPGHQAAMAGNDLLNPAPPSIGATSTPALHQQPIAVATARPAPLATPTKPNGQPLVASVAQPQSLQVGNTQVAQSGGTTNAQTAPAPAPSIAHDLTHNPVTNIVGTTIKPLVQAGAAVAYTPETIAREIQNKPIGDIQQKVFGTQNPGAIAKAIPSDLAQVGLTIGAPGLSKLIEGGVSRALPEAPSIVAKLASSGAIGSGYNAVSAAGQGANAKQVVEAGGVGLGLGLAAPVAGALARPVTSALLDHASALQPLNEVGAIGKNVPEQLVNKVPSPAPPENTPLTGVRTKTSAPIAEQGSANLTPEEISMGKALGMNAEEVAKAKSDMAELPSGDQMASFEPKTELNSPEVNTARNAYKSSLQLVQQGDYGQAIANGQVVSRPVDLATQQWQTAVKRLNPDEKANFWKAVENPSADHSPKLQEAVSRWRQTADMVHGNSQALGGNTNYVTDYALHPWDLPPELTEGAINGAGSKSFSGLNNVSRKYQTIAEGEAAGLKLSADPLQEGTQFLKASSGALRREALKQGLAQADTGAEKQPHTLDLGFGHTVQLSDEGRKATKGVEFSPPKKGGVVKAVRGAQSTAKSTLLSASQFHTNNISLLRAAPTLVAEGHPIAAAKGLYGSYRGAIGNTYTDKVLSKAVSDGTADKAALIGMPYGASDYSVDGTLGKTRLTAVGEHTVFGKQIPAMHDQVVRSVISDLEKKGTPLNSPEARAAGKAGNNLMGFVNSEAENVSPRVRQGMQDFLLASQLTPSKFKLAKTAVTKGGVAGSYARRGVAANAAALALIGGGIGFALHQKSDNIKDTLLRAILDPAVATPLKDSKGNTEKLRLPGGDTSDIAKLLGMKLVRGTDGHLAVSWKPQNVPSTVTDYLRARLSPGASGIVKVATNSTYAGKPLYDPSASGGTKIGQSLTSLTAGSLPIGLQGLAETKAIKDHLPGSARAVLTAQTPGTNPVLKSVASSFGATPATDQTVGKGQQSAQYYDALDKAKSGLNRQESDALDIITGSKKNPVTGKYDISPTAYDSATKANALLQNPKVLQHVGELNKQLQSEGQAIDPLYNLSPDQQKAYLQHETELPGSAEARQWSKDNANWYGDFSKTRSAFFDSLPPGDPNKPKSTIQYPDITDQTQTSMDAYSNITDPAQKAQYLTQHPEVSDAFAKQAIYTNQIRSARGAPELKGYPEADSQTQADLNAYNGLDKSSKSAFIKSHPNVSDYFTKAAVYGLESEGSLDQFKGNNPSQKELKDIYSVGNYDVTKNSDGTYTLGANPAGGSSGGSGYNPVGLQGYSMSNASVGRAISKATNKYHSAGAVAKPAKYLKVQRYGGKAKVAKVSKPKTLKATAVKGTL